MKLAIIICAAALAMTALILAERKRHKSAAKAMPPSTEIHRWEVDAILRSHPHRAALVRGTGSMLEIRGGDPDGITAVVIYDPFAKYDLLGAGTFVLFEHHSQGLLVHQLAQVPLHLDTRLLLHPGELQPLLRTDTHTHTHT